MAWLSHMIMGQWWKGTINHLLRLNNLCNSLLLPVWNICFMQKANLYFKLFNDTGKSRVAALTSLSVAKHPRSKNKTLKAGEAMELVASSSLCNCCRSINRAANASCAADLNSPWLLPLWAAASHRHWAKERKCKRTPLPPQKKLSVIFLDSVWLFLRGLEFYFVA